MTLTLDQLNAADQAGFTALLDGVYEHSPWIASQTWAAKPFRTLTQLKHALATTVRQAPEAAQLELIRAHPEYHRVLTQGERALERDFGGGDTNPFLHMSMHIAIKEQLSIAARSASMSVSRRYSPLLHLGNA